MVDPRGIGVVAIHVVLRRSKIASDAEDDHKADVCQNCQLPTLFTAATSHVLGGLQFNLMHWWKWKLNLNARTMEKPLGWDLHAQTDCPFGRWSCVGGCEAHWARTLGRLGSSSKNVMQFWLVFWFFWGVKLLARQSTVLTFNPSLLSSKRDLSAIFWKFCSIYPILFEQ